MRQHRLVLFVACVAMGIVFGSWFFTKNYIQHYGMPYRLKYDMALKNITAQDRIVPLAIIGSGCAGLAAAVYGARLHIPTVVFEGKKPGGQLTTTTWVENWPAFEKILGTDIILRLKHQALSFGARMVPDTIIAIDTKTWPFVLTMDDGSQLYALSMIIATGANPRKLEVPGEDTLWGKGVTTCAICDAPFYKDGTVVVVGGGDSAIEEALQLAPYAKHIIILVRGQSMRASAAMQDHLSEYAHIEVWFNTRIKEIKGKDHVSSIIIEKNNHEEELEINAVFLAIGHVPNTQLIKDQLTCDSNGYIILDQHTQETSRQGIFAAGDVADHRYRQAGVAAGDGIKAALDAAQFLREHGFNEDVVGKLKSQLYDPATLALKVPLQKIGSVEDFESLVKNNAEKIVVLDFYTDYCPSCLQMMPVVEAAAAGLLDKAVFAKVNALEAVDLTKKYAVPTVPMLLVFKDGALVGRNKDTLTRAQLQAFIHEFIG